MCQNYQHLNNYVKYDTIKRVQNKKYDHNCGYEKGENKNDK